MAIEALTVERRTNPIGIDLPKPRFAWRVGVDSNARQVASQLQVVDTDNSHATWSAPTWETGRLENSDSTYVPTADRRSFLATTTHWRVRTWNADGSASRWSTAGVFEVGLLWAADWPALGRSLFSGRPARLDQGQSSANGRLRSSRTCPAIVRPVPAVASFPTRPGEVTVRPTVIHVIS